MRASIFYENFFSSFPIVCFVNEKKTENDIKQKMNFHFELVDSVAWLEIKTIYHIRDLMIIWRCEQMGDVLRFLDKRLLTLFPIHHKIYQLLPILQCNIGRIEKRVIPRQQHQMRNKKKINETQINNKFIYNIYDMTRAWQYIWKWCLLCWENTFHLIRIYVTLLPCIMRFVLKLYQNQLVFHHFLYCFINVLLCLTLKCAFKIPLNFSKFRWTDFFFDNVDI